jgi:CO/xanthine dehydrogenase Mo-binding subunit
VTSERVGIGVSATRVDAEEKVTGRARFTGDLVVPGMLHGKILRSPVPHARIERIDASRAESLPGVTAVLTGRDILDLPNPLYGHAIRDRPILAVDVVRFVGEPVAAVAAEDVATALEALDLIEVEYADLPLVDTLDKALAPDAPRLHDVDSLQLGLFHGLGGFRPYDNVCYYHTIRQADEGLEAAFERAEIVVEDDYTFPAVYQYAMEPHTVVAAWGRDSITVWASCQHPYLVRAELADLFELAASRVRVIVSYLGGGFGSKSYTKLEPLTVALARKAGHPVRIALSVEEAMVTTRRHNMKCRMRTAATAEGRLVARQVRLWLDTGAYADNGPRVVATAADAAPGPYRWEHVAVDAWGVYTNRPPAGSYRAFGATHLQWIGESQVDEVARRAALDALTIRERNLLRPGQPVRPGGKPLDADLVGDVRKLAEALDWTAPKPPGVGRGISVGLLAAGAHPVSSAILRLEADGRATLLVSSTEMGQGVRTVLGQLVAQELALPLDRIHVPGADTWMTPYDRSTGASRSTTLAGTAVQRAALDVREQLLHLAAQIWGVEPDQIGLRQAAVWWGDESMSYPELFRRHFGLSGGELVGRGRVQPEGSEGSYAAGPYFWEVCVGGVELEVDRETGRVHVRRLVSVADVGQAVNPQLIKAQEMGATLQGLGNALFEEMIFSDGQLLNGTLLDYHVPTTEDMPQAFTSVLAENEDGPGPYGLKGVGEGALAAVPAAIANALADLGIHMTEMPFTPERVWRAMQAAPPRAP